ncbi:hypothetical protein MMC13_000825 [Lambiella insularis]|nr:hypothetical protein [Lambiella insularis]
MGNEGGLTDREAAIDAVIRFVCALDNGNSQLSASSLTKDAIMDLSPFSKAGMQARVVHGREEVVDILMSKVGRPLDTTHSATNIRCALDGDHAELTCTILAQHFRGGQGPSPEFQEFWFNGNQYKCDIVRDGGLWKIRKVLITPVWTFGNPDVMNV